MRLPQALIFAGPNGSGKSTLTRQIREEGRIPFPDYYINADDIAREVEGTDQEARERAAFRRARGLRQEYREQGLSFAFETVFSHPSTLIDMLGLKRAGYGITLVYVTTGDVEVNVGRVARRVLGGGHDVPEDKIRTRYERSLTFLPRVVEMADESFIYDATDATQLVAIGRGDSLFVREPLPDYLERRLHIPLKERAAERAEFGDVLRSAETLEAPDEDAGEYAGRFRQVRRHYALQDCGGQRVVFHDRSLLTTDTLTTGRKPFRVRYSAGYGTVTTP